MSVEIPTLFDTAQAAQAGKAESKLSGPIKEFIGVTLHNTESHGFYLKELYDWVLTRAPEANPDSISRIMRLLRANGEINVECVSRARSFYVVKSI